MSKAESEQHAPMKRRLLTLAEVEKAVPFGRTRLQKFRESGALPCIHVGKRVYVTPEALDEFIDRLASGDIDGTAFLYTRADLRADIKNPGSRGGTTTLAVAE